MDEKNLAMHKVEVDNTAQNASSNSEETSSKHLSRDDSDHVSIDPKAEQKLIRKLDFVLLPLFTLIYACNFIDRTAIGNARIAGLEKDLDMHGFDFNIALTTFYISYIVSEIPSNLALKRFGSIWIAFLVISFGAVAIGSAFVKSFGSLLVTRVLLGFAEGGTLSGLVYILARYYRRHELVLRVGIFFGLSPSLAGAFGGLLASGLLSVSDIGDVQRWRKIFLIEGIITIGFGILLIFFMPADPTVTRLFNDEERELAIARLDADQVVKTGGRKEPTTWKLVLRSFNFNTTLCTVAYIMINISFQGLSLFLPTVINTLGHYTTVEAQLRTVPPYLAGAVWALVCAWFGYKIKQRCAPIILSVLLMVIGYSIAISTKNPHARYAACFLSVAGGSPSGPMYLTWATDNSAPDTMRAVTTAVIPGFGQLGSVIAVWTYLPTDAPDFHKGNTLNLITSVISCVITALGGVYILWENRKRDRGERDGRLEGKSQHEIEQLGYLHPEFRYQL
uniref:Major facilitator superfamily (MFS) profile domain-containing protein n=1 Tax=Psilocybe cubensis TaxID=181762 RepID=A0A8H8CIL2_PSICU